MLLYGNFWIALCSTALVWQTEFLLTGTFDPLSVLSRFLFCSTLFLYAAHRIVGLEKVSAFHQQGRFKVIYRHRRHIRIYAIIGAMGAAWYFFQLKPLTQILMVPAGIISLAYVLPIWTGLRLRDVHYVKIFLIALVFSYVTACLPLVELGWELSQIHWGVLLERCLFLLAITLPFDIRDLLIDKHTHVKTIPQLLGPERTMRLALALLGLVLLLALAFQRMGLYAPDVTIGYIAALIITGVLIYFSPRQQHDYYFSGLLDGSMLLIFLGSLFGYLLL
ncbi:MAG: hypothetical protein KDC34_11270 [Saprospiraceae bacterium]|nr:hypothetical protein [Saprospiraceae bacterium]